VTQYAVQLLKRIDESRGQPMDVTKWFNFYGFDVMGDVGFGQELGMLREGETHYFMSATYQFMLVVRLFSHLVWLFPLYKMLPVVNQNVKRFEGWIVEQVQDRRKVNDCLAAEPLFRRGSADGAGNRDNASICFRGF